MRIPYLDCRVCKNVMHLSRILKKSYITGMAMNV